MTAPSFSVISGRQVHEALHGKEKQIVDLVERAYRVHGDGRSVNPPSYFLRFPDRPDSRIIALPASLGGEFGVDGLKWISSFPGNITSGLPRASAVLLLNDQQTGYPYACLEASIISAVRTAASAALAADRLTRSGERPRRIGFIGTGLIARFVHTYLAGTGWSFDQVGVHDLVPAHAEAFRGYLTASGENAQLHSAAEVIEQSDLLVFATVAGTPHVHDPALFAHNPVVLHVSLRDLSPAVILSGTNVVDDVDHCLRANTSVHLAEQETGHRDFVDGTLYDVLTGALTPSRDRPLLFSPFGLGVLDLAVGGFVCDELAGQLEPVDGFFHELSRYGTR